MSALAPSASLLAKLGSLAVHAEEGLSSSGHEFDIAAIQGLLADAEIIAWLEEMRSMAMLPEKR